MFETIRWRCYVHAADRRGAGRVVGHIEKLLPCPVEIVGHERYWKFPELAEVRLVTPLVRPTPEQALLTTLQWAWTIATPWSLLNPESGTHQEFEGIASVNAGARFSVAGVEWMEFTISDRHEDTTVDPQT
ncbi:hypothetical protein ACIQVL_06875 [Streptomyces sp. NPDC090499]|uniref:hypothetical protein n=1 Tax=Streptomyces sp. NPDC090499 TaxID=3365965 RepID=UPI0038209D63